MDFLDRLNDLMRLYELNRHTLSQKSGIPYTTIDGWYKKGFSNTKLPALQKLACFFDCSLDYLLGDTDNPRSIHSGAQQTSLEALEIAALYDKATDHQKNIVKVTLEYDLKKETVSANNVDIAEKKIVG